MNYVLSEKSAAWLRRQMAKDRGYKPATAAPSRLVRRDGSASASSTSLRPLTVRFVPSAEEGAEVGDGDFIIYVPAGSVVVNGSTIQADDVPLSQYSEGAYAGRANWYALPHMVDGDEVVLSISYDPEDAEDPLIIGIYTGEPVEYDHADGIVEREIIVANVSVTQPGDGVAGGVQVDQVIYGPLVLEVGVETLNDAMGRLSVVGGKDGMKVVDGEKYWIKVEREEGSSDIEVSLTDVPPEDEPEEDEDDGYCNDISDEDGGNEISSDSGGGGDDGRIQGGNEISDWPCNKGDEE